MRPALMILAEETGMPGLASDPDTVDALLASSLDLARQVGGVGRVLLFHPVEAESRLARRALGFRLWPQEGATPAERYAAAFRQAGELGYEGAVVIRLNVPDMPPERLSEAASMLEEHQGVIAPDGHGGIALLALQRPEPTLFPAGEVPSYDELRTRAKQQLIRLAEIDGHEALTEGTVGDYLARSER